MRRTKLITGFLASENMALSSIENKESEILWEEDNELFFFFFFFLIKKVRREAGLEEQLWESPEERKRESGL